MPSLHAADAAPAPPIWPPVAAIVALLRSLGLVFYTTAEAREERRAALEAVELRMDALIVYTADAVYQQTQLDSLTASGVRLIQGLPARPAHLGGCLRGVGGRWS